jgi:hypothetical protein
MDHLDIWQKVARPPETALKKIVGGRLAGMTDINPQWRLKAMTEVFGPCGQGWRWTIEKLWTEPGASGEVMAFALVNVSFMAQGKTDGGEEYGHWSDPIPGIGGSALIAKESAGLRANDEAYKMAVTDALSVALKCLGVASDIYERKYDGSKYTDAPNASALQPPAKLSDRTPAPGDRSPSDRAARPPEALSLTGEDDPLLTDTQRKKLFALIAEHGVSTEGMRAFCSEKFQVQSRAALRYSHLQPLVAWVKAHKKEAVA